jgi:hypothetical protein
MNPVVLALLGSSAVVLAVTAVAAASGLSVLIGWDPNDSGTRQLARERLTFLVQATVRVVLACQLLSLFLFIATADRLHALFTGAMCAAGTLNAHPLGYPTLAVKLAAFVLCGAWLVVNRASPAASSTGVVRFKHLFLLGVFVILLADNILQFRYFSGLDPEIITSCCATIFGGRSAGLGSDIATLPVRESRFVFAGVLALTLGAGARSVVRDRSPALFAVLALVLGVVSVVAVVTWIAPGFYQLPTHHCPFCLLAPEYGWVGYLLYALLFVAVLAGGCAGVVRCLRSVDPLGSIAPTAERRLCTASVAGFVLFSLLSVWPLVASDLRTAGY